MANIVNELKHFNGRSGLGAVMGNKRLRPIVVRGHDRIEPKDKEGLQACLKWFRDHYKRDADMLHKFGTSRNVMAMSADSILPTRNFLEGQFEHAKEISGQTMAETILTDEGTCYACAIACKRDVDVPERGVTSKYGGPEYETIGSGGSVCGVGDLGATAKFHQICGEYVMDTISVGMTIAWAMECFEKGILTSADTDGLDLRFGNAEAMLTLTERIGKREGFGDLLALGSERAARRIGNGAEEFALTVKKQELPMHEPRGKQGLSLAYATAPAGADHMRAPHDPADDPTKVPAPYRIFTREQLLQMPQQSQFLLMNASKSDDFYAQYGGVTLENLLDDLLLGSATGTVVYAPDGFSQSHPLYPDAAAGLYHIFGDYPAAAYYYESVADMAKNPAGWCKYDAPSTAGRNNGDPIVNPAGLKLLLAITRDGAHLTTGVLNKQNTLDGEGPFRVVPPQKLPGPPDQRSTAANQSVIWPYDVNADHNAGFSTRSTTIIKVEPLPEGTTDINLLEAGWPYVDEAKIVVYGAIDPVPNILEKLDALEATLEAASKKDFRNRGLKELLVRQVKTVERFVEWGWYGLALRILQNELLPETDACYVRPARHSNDLIADCDLHKQVQWALNEIVVLVNIAKAEKVTQPPPICHISRLCLRHEALCGTQGRN